MELTRAQAASAFAALRQITAKHVFDTKALNVACIKNRERLKPHFEDVRAKRQDIFDGKIERYSENDDIPDDRDVGDPKTQTVGGRTLPVFTSDEARALAIEKLDSYLSEAVHVDVRRVPEEAMEVPEGEPLDMWAPLSWMFEHTD